MNIDRVNSELSRQIAAIIHDELRDPRINGIISVIEVRCSNDLSAAKVFVSVYQSSNASKEVVLRLNASQGYIRNLLKTRVKMRNIPILEFILDESIDFALKIDEILGPDVMKSINSPNTKDDNGDE